MENLELKKKNVRVCQGCCEIKDIKNLYWVDKHTHNALFCIDCIQNNNLKISHPFKMEKDKECI
jgi:hypothetical protein